MDSFLHRKTFYAVLIADAVLFPLATYLASIDIKSWMIEIPMLVLNLPGFPVAIVFSVIGDDPNSNMSPIVSTYILICMGLSIVLTSSVGWAFVAYKFLGPKKIAPIS